MQCCWCSKDDANVSVIWTYFILFKPFFIQKQPTPLYMVCINYLVCMIYKYVCVWVYEPCVDSPAAALISTIISTDTETKTKTETDTETQKHNTQHTNTPRQKRERDRDRHKGRDRESESREKSQDRIVHRKHEYIFSWSLLWIDVNRTLVWIGYVIVVSDLIC